MLFELVLLPFLFSLAVSFLASPISLHLAKKWKLVDDPQKNKHPKVLHTKPLLRGGVVGVYISIVLSVLLFMKFDTKLIAIVASVTILLITGLIDDRFDLNPYKRLLIQIVVALIPIAAGIGISYITNPLQGGVYDLSGPKLAFTLFGGKKNIWVLSDIFALFWIVALMNFVNMGAKGIPGQMPGVSSIAAITIALFSLNFSSSDTTEWPVTILASIVAGGFAGFIPYNMFPQKIMPGFGGSTLAGFLLAICAILSTTKVGTLTLVLAIPLIDTGYTIIRRIYNKKSPVWGDRGHLHHKLLSLGWSQKKVTYFYWATTASLGALALVLRGAGKLYTISAISISLGLFLLWYSQSKKLKGS